MLRKINPFEGENKSFFWWWLGIKVGVITALIIWWWLDQQNKKQTQPANDEGDLLRGQSIPLLVDEAPPTIEKASQPESAPSKPDDLRKIEGIGPKIQATLQTAGIETFGQLATAKPTDLKQILVDAGIRIGYPETWPEQAALAAKDEWDALAEFQSTLQGGRRVG